MPLLFIGPAVVLLAGCASKQSPLAETLHALLFQGASAAAAIAANPSPQYQYLRVEHDGAPPALLVLGYVDPHPRGNIEVWYSARQEVIKVQNGRLVETTGLSTDWTSVTYVGTLPAWGSGFPETARYTRLHDEMPGYRYSVEDHLELTPLTGVPKIDLPPSLPPSKARQYQWYREIVTGSRAPNSSPAWFAWGTHRGVAMVVYSEQCLSVSLCLKLQRWPMQD